MGMCKIQRPIGSSNKGGRHGKLYASIVCDGIAGEKYKFDATKGDLQIQIECEEDEGGGFLVENDFATQRIWEAINELISVQEEIKEKLNTLEFEITKIS